MTPTWWRSLRAEWLRISHRWDTWLAAALVIGGAMFLYLSAFRASTSIMGVENPGSWGSGSGTAPDQWFLDAMLSLRAPYAFPASLVTVMDSAWLLAPLGAYAAVATIGPDFWWGTARSILITNRSRARYLAGRLAIILFLVVACLVLIVALAAITQLVLVLFAGERFPAGSLKLQTFVELVGARLIEIVGYTLIGAALALIARSLAGGIVLLVGFVAVDIAVGGIAASMGSPVVRELTFSGAVNSIVEQLRPQPLLLVVDYSIGALVPATHQPAPPAHLLSIQSSATVALVWVGLAAVIAFVRMRTMDIAD